MINWDSSGGYTDEYQMPDAPTASASTPSSDPTAPVPMTGLRPIGTNPDTGKEYTVNDPVLPGYHYDNPTTPKPTPTTSGGRMDEAAIRAQIAQWASMAGADPSLAKDPDYWVRRILETGGLGPDNLSYWQNAGVGAGAFFNNPNREGPSTLPGTNVGPGPSSFSDADTKYLTDLLNARMNDLKSPVNDAMQQQLLALLGQQTGYYQSQRAAQEAANAQLKARMEQANVSAQALVDYMNKRVNTLQQPAYTGAEAEVLRTRALDPIEADRQAARQRALNQASQSGAMLSSGINQALLNNTDASFDRQRAGAQNDLAYKQINEQRSREQEAQALLAQIPQIQRAGASGDLAFLQALDRAINQPQLGAIATAGQGAAINQANREEQTQRQQELLGLAQLLQQLPTNAAQQAMAAAGLAGNPENLLNSMIQLYGIGQNQQSNWAQTLGQTLNYLSNTFGRSGSQLAPVGG